MKKKIKERNEKMDRDEKNLEEWRKYKENSTVDDKKRRIETKQKKKKVELKNLWRR